LLLQERFLVYNSPNTVWRLGPLGELERSPQPPIRKTGGLLLRGGKGREEKGIGWEGTGREGTEKEGRVKGRERKRGREGEESENSWIRPWARLCRKRRENIRKRFTPVG